MTVIPDSADNTLGSVVLQCRPRSGTDYWNRGCAAASFYYAFFVIVAGLSLSSLPIIFMRGKFLMDQSEWLVGSYFLGWCLVSFLVPYTIVCSLYAYWLRQGSLWLHENGIRGAF